MKPFPHRKSENARSQNGVYFVRSADGRELPVLDITHESFHFDPGPRELESLVARAIRAMDRRARMPRAFAKWLFSKALRSSTIIPKIVAAYGRYLDGMCTYLFKLGAENLGPWATKADARVVGSLPGVSVRVRLTHCATLLADEIERLDAQGPCQGPGRELHLVNIAGGTCSDSINALLLLARRSPPVLRGRRIVIHSFDREDAGAEFARLSLVALRQEGAPLAACQIEFDHVAYDWKEASTLRAYLSGANLESCLAIASSEGGLFEYGSDEEILENLGVLSDLGVSSVVGTISRTDALALRFNGASGAALKLRGLDVFGELVRRAGFQVAKVVDSPLSHCFLVGRVG